MPEEDEEPLTDEERERLLNLQPTGEQYSSVYDMLLREGAGYEFLQEFVDECEKNDSRSDEEK